MYDCNLIIAFFRYIERPSVNKQDHINYSGVMPSYPGTEPINICHLWLADLGSNQSRLIQLLLMTKYIYIKLLMEIRRHMPGLACRRPYIEKHSGWVDNVI